MKKTLFLSAILGAALCSSALAADYTINKTNDTTEIKFDNNTKSLSASQTGDNITLNVTLTNGGNGSFFENVGDGQTKEIKANLIIDSLVFNNGYSKRDNEALALTYLFSGNISGSGAFNRGANQSGNNFRFTGDVSGYTGAITFSTSGNVVKNRLIFDASARENGMTVNAASITMQNSAKLETVGNVTFVGTDITAQTLNIGEGTMTLGSAAKLGLTSALSLGSGSALALSDGTTLKLDNMSHAAFTYDESQSSGITNRNAAYTLATGEGSVSRTGSQNATLNNVAQNISWTDDNKILTVTDQVYHVLSGAENAVSVTEVNTAVSAASVSAIVVDGTLTGIKKPNDKNMTDAAIPSVNITGTGTVQVDGTFQYYNQSFLEDFAGTVEITAGETHIGDQGGKFAHASQIMLSGGSLKGWGTTFGRAILLNGGTLSSANNNMTYSGAVTITGNSTIESVGSSNGQLYVTTLSGSVDARDGVITIMGHVKSTASFDMSGNKNKYTSSLTITSGAMFTSTSNLWVSNNASNITTFTLEENGKFIKGDYTLTGLAGGGSFAAGATEALNMNGSNTLTNLKAEYSGSAASTSAKLSGTTALKNVGENLLTFTGSIGSNAMLEGVMGENGVSNVKFTAKPEVASGTIKNVNIANYDAGAQNVSISMDGVVGTVKNGGNIYTVNLVGNGLTLTAANYFTTILTGSGNLTGSSTAMESGKQITMNAVDWTGTYQGKADSAIKVTGNSGASFEGGETATLTLTLQGTTYTGDHISNAVVTTTSTNDVVISNKLTNVDLTTVANTTLSSDGNTLTGLHAGAGFNVAGNTTLETEEASANSIAHFIGMSADKTLTIAGKAALTLNTPTDPNIGNGIWMQHGSSLDIGANASLEVKAVGLTFKNGSITNTSKTTEEQMGTNGNKETGRANITISADTTVNAGMTSVSGYTFDGGSVTVNSGTTTTIKSALSATTDLTVKAGSSVTFTQDAEVKSLTWENGALELNHNLAVSGSSVTLSSVTLNNGADITVNNHNGTLDTTNLTVSAPGSEMNANLVVSRGTLTFAKGAVLTMGCNVTIESSTVYVTIDSTFDAFMADLRAGNTSLVVIDGLDSEDEVQTLTIDKVCVTDKTGSQYTNNELGLKVVANSYTGNGDYAIVVAPEPATATLSLLALAGLCARRRRH